MTLGGSGVGMMLNIPTPQAVYPETVPFFALGMESGWYWGLVAEEGVDRPLTGQLFAGHFEFAG